MKKGLLYIDWSISVAIFIVYLVGLFVYMAPVLSQDYSEEYLKTLARTGFQEETFTTAYKYPILIKHNAAGEFVFNLNAPSNLNLISLSTGIYSEDLQTEIDSYKLIVNDGSPDEVLIKVSISEDEANDEETKKFYMILSDHTDYTHDDVLSSDEPPLRYAFGVPEISFGLSESKFINLRDEYRGYEEIKKKLKYPKEKEISIIILNTNLEILKDNNNNELIIAPDKATQNDTVYATQWSAMKINKNSETEPIIIRILTW